MLSIAMTTYNGSKYLQKQLDSILNQSYSDFELVICDDCSIDDTFEILKIYEKRDSRIKIFKNNENIGFSKNFEKTISLCKFDYIALADQDDIWKENHLELLLSNLNDSSASVGNADIMNSFDEISCDLLSNRDLYFVDGNSKEKLFRILCYGNPFQGTSSLYRKELFKYAFPIPDDVEYHDAWFSAVACCLKGLNYSFDVVTHYRIHGRNASGEHKINFFRQVGITLKRKTWETDRIIFCDELLTRIPNISKEIKNIILISKYFHENRINGNRLKTIIFILKNYKKIYATDNYKKAFSRCMGILLKG